MNPPNLLCLSLVGVLLGLSAGSRAAEPALGSPAGTVPLYIGTYTGPGKSQGIYLSHLDLATGTLSEPQLAAKTVNPSFLAQHPSHKFLFANNEIGNFKGKNGAATGFAIDGATGKLTEINQVSSGGPGPCHLSFDRDGKHLLIANWGGGSFAVIPVGDDGKMAELSCFVQDDTTKQQPRAHCIQFDPASKFVLGNDAGLDRILVFKFDPAKGVLSPNDPPFVETAKGAGPRHLAFHPNGKWAYDINEANSTLTAYAWDGEHGVLKEIDTKSTLPKSFEGKNSCAEVQVHPNGKFVYGSNRGDDSIVGFEIDPKSSELKFVGNTKSGGKMPRNFALDPSGSWLLAANQDSDNIVVFKVDAQTGELKPNGKSISLSAPVCLTFVSP